MNSSYSTFADIFFGVTQGSMSGPLLFNICICDIFFENYDSDIANYDNNRQYDSPV